MWLLLEDALHRQAGMHVAKLARDCALGGLPGVVAAWELLNVGGPAALQGPDLVGALALTSADAPLAEELRCVVVGRVCSSAAQDQILMPAQVMWEWIDARVHAMRVAMCILFFQCTTAYPTSTRNVPCCCRP